MRAQLLRVGRNRRRTCLSVLLLVVGALLFLAAFPTMNGAALLGLAFMATGAGGFAVVADSP